jgi:hypothetical protein
VLVPIRHHRLHSVEQPHHCRMDYLSVPALPTSDPLPFRRQLRHARRVYDRNPQTFVPNSFWAKPRDYRNPALPRPDRARLIELPLVGGR